MKRFACAPLLLLTMMSGCSESDASTEVDSTGGGPAAGGTGGTSASGGMTGAGAAETGPPPTFATVMEVFKYMQPSCMAAPCHGGVVDPIMNDDATATYQHLLDTVSDECGSLRVVEPGKPEASALVKIMKEPCGEAGRMPQGCVETEEEDNCVPDEYVAAIEQWILNGAPPF